MAQQAGLGLEFGTGKPDFLLEKHKGEIGMYFVEGTIHLEICMH